MNPLHLDLLHKVALFKLLKKLTKETNKCILFSTHDIDMAIQLSDEMIIMTPETVVQDEPCNFISKGTFNNLKMNILFLIQIKEVCDRIKPLSAPQKKGD
jgi:ABC-type cobalamin/Fe3+-siderophores transport system ATPase subunit